MATLTDPGSTSPLTNPSHSALHTAVNGEIRALDTKVSALEGALPAINTKITQARAVANTWTISGVLATGIVNKLMLPVLWNLGTVAEFQAAKASVFGAPAGSSILIDLRVGMTLTSDSVQGTSILTTPLTIPAGQNVSAAIGTSGFVGGTSHAADGWVTAVVAQIGSSTPGTGLTIQLNRLL